MNETVLLLDAVPVWHMDFGAPLFDNRQSCANEMHGLLLVETGGDQFGEVAMRKTCHGVPGFWLRPMMQKSPAVRPGR